MATSSSSASSASLDAGRDAAGDTDNDPNASTFTLRPPPQQQSQTQPQPQPQPQHVVTSPFVGSDLDPTDGNCTTALVILNAPIPQRSGGSRSVFDRLWDGSSYRVCADGGANRLYVARWGASDADDADVAPQRSREGGQGQGRGGSHYVPDLIVGDLDSLHPTVRRHFEAQGCRIHQVQDQDRNDLDKALEAVRDEQDRRRTTNQRHSSRDPPSGAGNGGDDDVDDDNDPPSAFRHVVVYGAFGGRFDQEMASLQALYQWGDAFGTDTSVWLYNEDACACLLQPDNVPNVVTVCPEVEDLRSVGLIPLGRRCERVHTTGFRWNVSGDAMEFGGLVSTSNEMTGPTVTVQATHRLVFTAAVRSGALSEWTDPIIVEAASNSKHPPSP